MQIARLFNWLSSEILLEDRAANFLLVDDFEAYNAITIGIGTKNSPAAGGSGQMNFDDIRLY